MTEVEVLRTRAAKTERLAALTLRMLDRVFSDPSLKPRVLDNGSQLITGYSYFCQCHIHRSPEGKYTVLNFPVPCEEVEVSKVLGSPGEIEAYGTARVLQLARGLRELMKHKNILDCFKKK